MKDEFLVKVSLESLKAFNLLYILLMGLSYEFTSRFSYLSFIQFYQPFYIQYNPMHTYVLYA